MGLRRVVGSRLSQRSKAFSTAASGAAENLSPPPPDAMLYDRAAELVHSKLKRLSNPDPRFLKHTSPHPTLTDHTAILRAPATRITTLPNGLRVATESNLAAKNATVGVWIEAGSRFESDESNGTAYFLNQMLFCGTKKRRLWGLWKEVENMGAHLEAYCFREQTAYFAKVLDEDVAASLYILSDILQNSAFRRFKIREQRDEILSEIQSNEKVTIFDHLHATAFQHTSLGRTILGPAENIRTINKTRLRSYLSTHYTVPRMVIVASGAVKHKDVVDKVERYFTEISTDPTTASQLVANEPALFTGSEVRMIDDDVEFAQFVIAFKGASFLDPDSIALMVMKFMLGSWNKNAGGGKHMGSGLVQRVSINEIAEDITAFTEDYRDTGLFGVRAVAKPDCLADLAWAIMHEMSKLCYRVSDDDVTRACNKLKLSMLRHISGGTFPIADDIGRQLLRYGRRIPYAELFARIDAVDASTIKRVANRFIYDRDVAIVAMGPVKNLPDYNWFRRRTYWNRY